MCSLYNMCPYSLTRSSTSFIGIYIFNMLLTYLKLAYCFLWRLFKELELGSNVFALFCHFQEFRLGVIFLQCIDHCRFPKWNQKWQNGCGQNSLFSHNLSFSFRQSWKSAQSTRLINFHSLCSPFAGHFRKKFG